MSYPGALHDTGLVDVWFPSRCTHTCPLVFLSAYTEECYHGYLYALLRISILFGKRWNTYQCTPHWDIVLLLAVDYALIGCVASAVRITCTTMKLFQCATHSVRWCTLRGPPLHKGRLVLPLTSHHVVVLCETPIPASGAIDFDMWRSLLNMETPRGEALDGGPAELLVTSACSRALTPRSAAEFFEQLQGGREDRGRKQWLRRLIPTIRMLYRTLLKLSHPDAACATLP